MARLEGWTPCLDGKRVLVTGAGGFIGGQFVARLVRAGARVAAVSRTESPRWPTSGTVDFTPMTCDVRDPRAVARVVGEFAPEILFHFAAHPDGAESHEQADAAVRVNVLGTLNLLEAFTANQGRLFVFGDSTKVYGNGPVPYRESLPPAPTSSYAIAKGAAWEFCRLYERLHETAVISLRPTMIYGPGQGRNVIGLVIEGVLAGKTEIPLMGGSQTRDPLFIDDALEAFLAAARVGPRISGRIVALGGGAEISVHELARLVVEIMGARTKIVIQPQNARPTEIWRSYCDNEGAKALLGWTPSNSLEEGIRKTVDAMMATSGMETLGASSARERASAAGP